jgi:ectoine hydroxylase-related dioxygenase (phytanoyl-CoA dioxygenase family)
MPAGAIAVFQGTLIHGAGANRSRAPRLAFTSQYCAPWARTQENFFLGVPRERVRAMSPALQSLLGYGIMPPFMGQVTASHPLKTLEEGWIPPIARQPSVRTG